MPDEVQDQDAEIVQPEGGDVVITFDRRDIRIPQVNLGVDMDTPKAEIISAVRDIIREDQGVDLADETGEVSYEVRKAGNSGDIYVYPKPVAG